jgi:hypothetical protein
MNYFFKTSIFLVVVASGLLNVSAAKIVIGAPSHALGNRQPVVLQLFIDQENDSVSGISGNLSFPSGLFTIDSIRTENSAVSLWVTQPKVSEEKYLDGRTHITFEGIFPGGFDGIRSPYYQGTKPGILFSVVLIPAQAGKGTFVVDNILLNAFNADATALPAVTQVQDITVPTLTAGAPAVNTILSPVSSPTLVASIEQSELINHNAWYLAIHEREPVSAIDSVYVAENDSYDVLSVPTDDWREVATPYILMYQDRTKYIHVKVLYSDNTFTTRTIAPVENSPRISSLSRILIGVLVILTLLYLYATTTYSSVRKKV